MEELKHMSDIAFKRNKNLLNAYQKKREKLKEEYHAASKLLTARIHELDYIVTKESGIRSKRGKYYVEYKKQHIYKYYEQGMTIEDISAKFEISKNAVIESIERRHRYLNRNILSDYIIKCKGIINDSIPIDILFYWEILTAKKFQEKGINTLADFYKNTNKLNKREIRKIESELDYVEKRFKTDMEYLVRNDWRYNG